MRDFAAPVFFALVGGQAITHRQLKCIEIMMMMMMMTLARARFTSTAL